MSEQMGFPKNRKAATFYDSACEALRAIAGENIHYGYWVDENDQSSLREAQEHLTDLVIDQLSVTPDARLLDVGCGTGESALHIAGSRAVSLVGIDISRVELALAEEKMRKQAISDRLFFQYADMTQMPFASDFFDGVYGIESLCHVPDRGEAFREIYRVLKPGGSFAFTDPCVYRTLSPSDAPAEDPSPWSVAYITLASLTKSLQTAGFTDLKVLDLSNNVYRTVSLYQQRNAEFIRNNTLEPEMSNMLRQTFEDPFEGWENSIGCFLVAARKPV